MARKKGRRGHRAKAIPLAVAAPVLIAGYGVAKNAMAGNTNMAMLQLTGVDAGSSSDKFKPQYLVQTYGPILAGVVVHKVANKIGANNYVRRASMGLLSI